MIQVLYWLQQKTLLTLCKLTLFFIYKWSVSWIEYYNRLDSTNEEAWELIDEGNQHGSIVITENQIKGKGRQNNNWSMVAGKGLAFTLILDKKYPSSFSSFFSLAAGISIAESLKKRGVESALKWPNDIYSSDKKIGGILCESK